MAGSRSKVWDWPLTFRVIALIPQGYGGARYWVKLDGEAFVVNILNIDFQFMSTFRLFCLALAGNFVYAQLIIRTVAGGGPNNIPALQTGLSYPWGIALDLNGNLFVSSGVRVFKVSPSGLLTVYAGNGVNGFGGDGGQATGASLSNPHGLAVDKQSNLYIADQANNRVRMVSAATGIITTVAGDGTGRFTGDGQPATNASLYLPDSIAIDATGNLYIGDTQNFRVRKVTVATGTILTVVGNGGAGYSGDGGLAVNAGFASLAGVALDSSGNIYIADGLRVRKVNVTTGIISTIAGSGIYGYGGDGFAATAAKTSGAAAVAVDQNGNVYFTDSRNNAVRKVDHLTQVISTVSYASGNPLGLQVESAGYIYYADTGSQVVRRQAPSPNPIQTPPVVVAGNGSPGGYSGDGGPATDAFINPAGIAIDGAGNLEIADGMFRVFRVNIGTDAINAIAGTGAVGNGGDGGPALSASFTQLRGVATDSGGNVYIVDWLAGNIRRVDAGTGIITTYAGLPSGSTADGIPATQASLGQPTWASFDGQDNLYVTDINSHRVRKINAQTGIITTVAGSGNFRFSGDGGPATSAGLDPAGTTFDKTGNLFIADSYNSRIRRVDAHTGLISTLAGNGVWEFTGDGGLATNAGLYEPTGVAVDGNDNIFIADTGNYRIRKVDSLTNNISTFAGTGQPGASGDGGPPTNATLYAGDIKIDAQTLYIAGEGRVRAITSSGSCFYTLSSAAANFDLRGGPGSFTVNSSAGCSWSVASNASWLTITGNSSGTASGTVTFTVAANPNPSLRSGTLSIAGRTFSVTQAAFGVTMSVDHTFLQFGTTELSDFVSSPQTVAVTFYGAGNVNWTVSSSSPSILLTPASGVGAGTFQVKVFGPGPSATVTVIANGVSNSPQEIHVSIATVTPAAPFGSFDTPLNNTAGIAGAIPVTGWALDNIEITKVDVWREPVGTEPVGPTGLVYIGDATFIDGARPDVQSKYPNTPYNYRAGWGYMMLTNFLPNNNGGSGGGGNGTYKLHAIAHDKSGASLDLGTRTVSADNVHASKPFGTIDTPSQGDTISGNTFVNFGWALTQNPYCVPTDGSTITVYVDSVSVGSPTYNQFRSDIATLFPGLCNTNGAVGFFYLDTTKLSSGLHSISWVVHDNQGRGDGIGSRYFTVMSNLMGNEPQLEQPPQTDANETVALRRGFDLNRRTEQLAPGMTGDYSVEIEELGRLELQLGANSGYLFINGEHHPLPIGSSLRGGTFSWQVGPGFLGIYPLVFGRLDGQRVHVLVNVQPMSHAPANNH